MATGLSARVRPARPPRAPAPSESPSCSREAPPCGSLAWAPAAAAKYGGREWGSPSPSLSPPHRHTRAHVCRHVHTLMQSRTHMHTLPHTLSHMCTHMCRHMHTLVYSRALTHVHTRSYTHVYIHALAQYTHMCTYTWTCARTHTCAHAHTAVLSCVLTRAGRH